MVLFIFVLQAEKQLELQLFKLYHNEKDIEELQEEMMRKNSVLEKEARKKESIEDEIRGKKKEHGHLTRELAKIDQGIKEAVRAIIIIQLYSLFTK